MFEGSAPQGVFSGGCSVPVFEGMLQDDRGISPRIGFSTKGFKTRFRTWRTHRIEFFCLVVAGWW